MTKEIDKIYMENCLEGLKDIDTESIDLIVTDPPYICAAENAKTGLGPRKFLNEINPISYGINEEKKFLEECMRVMKNPNIYIWCSVSQMRSYMDFFGDYDCSADILMWHKTNPIPLCNNKYLSDTEYCLFFHKNAKLYGDYESSKKYWITTINKEDKRKYGHPTVKPLNIIESIIRNSSRPGDVVLDPFLGSGTTAVAAVNTDRKYIGFEIEPTYYSTAHARINATQRAKNNCKSLNDF